MSCRNILMVPDSNSGAGSDGSMNNHDVIGFPFAMESVD